MAARMNPRQSLAAVAAIVAFGALSACATAPSGGLSGGASAFNAADFAWSSNSGPASIEGRIDYRENGEVFTCTGSVGLTPDTPYTRARFHTLYGSTDRAALPEAVVRARTVSDPNADYRSYVRSATCQDGRFSFSGLPSGGWFIIAPVSAGGDRVVLMRHVDTRNGRVAVTLP